MKSISRKDIWKWRERAAQHRDCKLLLIAHNGGVLVIPARHIRQHLEL